jgi:hypothetical protein
MITQWPAAWEVGFAPGSIPRSWRTFPWSLDRASCAKMAGPLQPGVLTDSISSIHLDSDLGTLRLADQFRKTATTEKLSSGPFAFTASMSGRRMRLHFGIYLKELSSLAAIFFHALRRRGAPPRERPRPRKGTICFQSRSCPMKNVGCAMYPGPLASSIA